MSSVFTVSLTQILVGVLLVVALLYGQRELTVLSLLVLAVMLATRLWTRMSTSGLKCDLTVDKRKLFPGESLRLTLSVENGKLLPVSVNLKVPVGNLLRRPSGEKVLTKVVNLLWFQRTQIQWELGAEQRGVYPIGPVHIFGGDPFSFFYRHKRADKSYTIIVYPKLIPLRPLAVLKRDLFGIPKAKRFVPDPIYILGTRDYQHGQPSRYIHWKASARHNRLQEKVFESSVQEKVLLVIDVTSFGTQEAAQDFESTIQVAASLAARLDQQGHSVGLVSNGRLTGASLALVPVAKNSQQLPTILEVLARLEMKPEQDIQDLLQRGLADTWGISCVFCSYEENETMAHARNYLSHRRTPAVFLVCQPHLPTREASSEMPHRVYRLDDIRVAETDIE